MLEEVLGSLSNINENLNNDSMNREYDIINNYEELIAEKVNIIVHACMPQLLTNIKAQQRIDDYGGYNDIMNFSTCLHATVAYKYQSTTLD
jgi:hypothetical protein